MTRLPYIAVFAAALSAAATAPADTLATQLIVRLETGEVQFFNSTASAVDIAGYSIESGSDSLASGSWSPVTGRLDAAGDGSFDAVANWVLLSAADDDGELAEGAFEGPGGTLGAGAFLSIGPAWDTAGSQDLTATALIGNLSTATPPLFTSVSDYDLDGDIDSDDFTLFAQTFGSTTDLRADGNGDGVVSGADYTVWRDALAVSGAGQARAFATPEPISVGLAWFALAVWSIANRWRKRR